MKNEVDIWDLLIEWIPDDDKGVIRVIDLNTNRTIGFPIVDVISKQKCDHENLRDELIDCKLYPNKIVAMRAVKRASSYFRHHERDIHGWIMVHNYKNYYFYHDIILIYQDDYK